MLELVKKPNKSFTVQDGMTIWKNLKTQDIEEKI